MPPPALFGVATCGDTDLRVGVARGICVFTTGLGLEVLRGLLSEDSNARIGYWMLYELFGRGAELDCCGSGRAGRGEIARGLISGAVSLQR